MMPSSFQLRQPIEDFQHTILSPGHSVVKDESNAIFSLSSRVVVYKTLKRGTSRRTWCESSLAPIVECLKHFSLFGQLCKMFVADRFGEHGKTGSLTM